MRAILLLAVVLLWYQEVGGRKTIKSLDNIHNELVYCKSDLQPRSITDIWDSIKNTANRAWEYIKDLANNTKKRITDWVAKIKIKAKDISKAFEEQLNKMKDRVNELIKNVMDTGETLKKCLQERKKIIDDILKKILFDVTNCISNSTSNLTSLNVFQYEPIPNQTEFLNAIQSDLNICMKKYKTNNEADECVQNIRKGIFRNLEVTEGQILRNHTEIRSATDDLLNTIVGCATDGIIKSSTAIANETIKIIECVSENQTYGGAGK